MNIASQLEELQSYAKHGLLLAEVETKLWHTDEDAEVFHASRDCTVRGGREVINKGDSSASTLSSRTLDFASLYELRFQICSNCGWRLYLGSGAPVQRWIDKAKALKEVSAFTIGPETNFEEYSEMIYRTGRVLEECQGTIPLSNWARDLKFLTDPQPINHPDLLRMAMPLIVERSKACLLEGVSELRFLKRPSVQGYLEEMADKVISDYQNYDAWVFLSVPYGTFQALSVALLNEEFRTFDNIFQISKDLYLLPGAAIPWLKMAFEDNATTIVEGAVTPEQLEVFKVLFSGKSSAYSRPEDALVAARAI